jgi:hypothetical protein
MSDYYEYQKAVKRGDKGNMQHVARSMEITIDRIEAEISQAKVKLKQAESMKLHLVDLASVI